MNNEFTKITHQFTPIEENKIGDCFRCDPYEYSGRGGSNKSDCGVFVFNTKKQQFIVLREFRRTGGYKFLIDVPIGIDNLIPHLLATLKESKIKVSENAIYLYLVPTIRSQKPDEFKFVTIQDRVDIEPQPFNAQQLVKYFKSLKNPVEVTTELLTYF